MSILRGFDHYMMINREWEIKLPFWWKFLIAEIVYELKICYSFHSNVPYDILRLPRSYKEKGDRCLKRRLLVCKVIFSAEMSCPFNQCKVQIAC